jgi:signal transduction histidine kinase
VVAFDPAGSEIARTAQGIIAADIRAVGQIQELPAYLDIVCDMTGMRFAAVARVTEHSWTACAVKDDINFGLPVGGTLPVETTLCLESKRCGVPIAFGHASKDLRYRNHHTPRLYKIESYISVPIVLRDGRYFGNLCAIDPAPADVANPKTIRIFERFAKLIAMSLDHQEVSDRDHATIDDQRATGELREQFIAILGHDLRNPLHAVYVSAEVLEKRSTDPAVVKEFAGRIKASAKRMSALIDDVLDFARGKLGGGLSIHVDEVADINGGLLAVVNELRDAQTDRQIVSEINVTQGIRCDLGRVQQITSNLISNALTHGSPQSPVKIVAHTNANELVLEVWNGGAPIPPENVAKIFEPFWRMSTSKGRQGLGLGLHICSQIVQAHKGKLSVTSTQTDGTTFTARLPLLSPPSAGV